MTRETTADLDRLARGQSIDRAAFLALLGDPAARQELQHLAQVRAVLASPEGAPDVPPEIQMSVSWEELAEHAEGALTEEGKRQAVERFLNQHFPEALQGGPGWADADTAAPGRMADTVAEPPSPAE
jgi:hypothetical protein